jgi:hypothetical protein
MKKILMLTVALVALSTLAQRPSAAGGNLPWCEQGIMSGNSVGDCSFATFEQCMQAARGDGYCERNPRFDAPYFQSGQPAPFNVDPNPARRRSR